MDELEFALLLLSGFGAFRFFVGWYHSTAKAWPPQRNKPARIVLGTLPPVSLIVIVYTLKVLASFDVVDSFVFLIFYILLGFVWIHLGMILMARLFDLSWQDDALHLGNVAALTAVAGGFLGITAIYAGANVGDGPGWWCVVFAGALGMVAWTALAWLVNLATRIFERITVERDLGCGIRLGAYLLASGILLGRASAGDWTSLSMTVIEFLDGWPVLFLAVFVVVLERFYIQRDKSQPVGGGFPADSVFWGALLVVLAILSVVLLPPLNQNPLYNGLSRTATW